MDKHIKELQALEKKYELHSEVMHLAAQCTELRVVERFNMNSFKNLKHKKDVLTRLNNLEDVSEEEIESILDD